MCDFLDSQGRIVSNALHAFIQSHPADETTKRPLYDAIGAYERIRRTSKLHDNLAVIVAAATDLGHPVGTFGRALLASLTRDHLEAQQSIRDMLTAPKAKVRCGIILATGGYAPDCDFKRDVLRKGLSDRSKTVRLQAIRAANLALVPDLRQHRESETDRELQRLIDEQVQFQTGEYVVNPDPGSVKSHSFYRRVENSIQHFVVNCVLENRWLQLEVVPYADRSVDPCTPTWFASPPVTRGVKAGLDPQRVVRAVLAGIAAENAAQGTEFSPCEIRFAQTDFDCYDLYREAARLLTRQILAGGPWLELMINGPGL